MFLCDGDHLFLVCWVASWQHRCYSNMSATVCPSSRMIIFYNSEFLSGKHVKHRHMIFTWTVCSEESCHGLQCRCLEEGRSGISVYNTSSVYQSDWITSAVHNSPNFGLCFLHAYECCGFSLLV